MERQKRETDSEKFLSNPCDYNETSPASPYEPKLAADLALQARTALRLMSEYKDTFASVLHSFSSYETLLKSWTDHKYLGADDQSQWLNKNLLPIDLIRTESVTEKDLDNLLGNIDKSLPIMYKALRLLVAGLIKVHDEVLNDNFNSDKSLKSKVLRSMHDVRYVLCLFSDIMRSRGLKTIPVVESEVPASNVGMALLVYRDTINYLEFLERLFQKMYDKKIA